MPRANRYTRLRTGCSAAWLARRVWVAEAAGSNPASPTKHDKAPQSTPPGQRAAWSAGGLVSGRPGQRAARSASAAVSERPATRLSRAAQPLTAGQHAEQRPDRFGDRL